MKLTELLEAIREIFEECWKELKEGRAISWFFLFCILLFLYILISLLTGFALPGWVIAPLLTLFAIIFLLLSRKNPNEMKEFLVAVLGMFLIFVVPAILLYVVFVVLRLFGCERLLEHNVDY